MAFDKENTAHLITLRDYGNSLGFAGSTTDIVNSINDPEYNPTPSNGAERLLKKATLKAIWLQTLSSQEQIYIKILFGMGDDFTDISDFRSELVALGGNMATAINGIVRALSWAEVNFGTTEPNGNYEYVVITRNDWVTARDYKEAG